MVLTDTHAHLYAAQFDKDRDEMIGRALEAGVQKMYLPNIDRSSIQGMLELEAAYPENCMSMMGLHPCSVKENVEEELKIVEEWLNKRDFVAVGEIGIDLYWDKTFYEEQEMAFLRQVSWAKSLNKPIVIHARESLDVLIELVRKQQNGQLRGVFHCFTGTEEQARQIADLGFFMGVGGVLTFKKAGLDKVAKNIPLDHLVLETDAPYLAPTPFRGKRNESAYIHQIADKLASIKEVELEELARITSHNAEILFS
jgi:TatD DNase family protein